MSRACALFYCGDNTGGICARDGYCNEPEAKLLSAEVRCPVCEVYIHAGQELQAELDERNSEINRLNRKLMDYDYAMRKAIACLERYDPSLKERYEFKL